MPGVGVNVGGAGVKVSVGAGVRIFVFVTVARNSVEARLIFGAASVEQACGVIITMTNITAQG